MVLAKGAVEYKVPRYRRFVSNTQDSFPPYVDGPFVDGWIILHEYSVLNDKFLCAFLALTEQHVNIVL